MDDFYREAFLGFLEENWELLSEEQIYIANIPGYRFEMSRLVNGISRKMSLVIFDIDEEEITFMLVSWASDSKQYEIDFQGVLDSIALIEGTIY